MLRIGGRSHATGVIPVVQRVVERVLSFHHLFAGKPKWKIRVGNKRRDMHQLYMGACNQPFAKATEGKALLSPT